MVFFFFVVVKNYDRFSFSVNLINSTVAESIPIWPLLFTNILNCPKDFGDDDEAHCMNKRFETQIFSTNSINQNCLGFQSSSLILDKFT